jgi:hypothetical protein
MLTNNQCISSKLFFCYIVVHYFSIHQLSFESQILYIYINTKPNEEWGNICRRFSEIIYRTSNQMWVTRCSNGNLRISIGPLQLCFYLAFLPHDNQHMIQICGISLPWLLKCTLLETFEEEMKLCEPWTSCAAVR